MGYVDKLAEFADATSVVNAVATINVGNVVNTQVGTANTLINQGEGQPVFLVILVATSILAADAGTIQFRLVSDSSEPPLTNGTATVHYQTTTFATDSVESAPVAAGKVLALIALPRELYEKFLGVQAVIAGNATTQGAIDAFLTNDARKWQPYADGIA